MSFHFAVYFDIFLFGGGCLDILCCTADGMQKTNTHTHTKLRMQLFICAQCNFRHFSYNEISQRLSRGKRYKIELFIWILSAGNFRFFRFAVFRVSAGIVWYTVGACVRHCSSSLTHLYVFKFSSAELNVYHRTVNKKIHIALH